MHRIALFLIGVSAFAADYYVAPDGSGTNCSFADPCTFTYIIGSGNPRGVVGGDTIFMRGDGDSYVGSFIVQISGISTAPILIRNYQDERVVIDNSTNTNPATLGIAGSYVRVQGFGGPTKSITIMDSNTDRIILDHLPCYPLCRPEGVLVAGTGVEIVHTIIRDNGQGIVSQGGGNGLLAYGNIIAYNGWQGPNRGHGHGAYLQNDSLTLRKRFENNIVYWQFGYCNQTYGSSDASVFGIDNVGNVCYDNGRIATSDTGSVVIGILVGGEADAHDVTVTDNWFFAPSVADQPRQKCLDPSYGPGTTDMTVTGNFVRCGKAIEYTVAVAGTFTCEDNAFYGTANANATAQCLGANGNLFGAFTASTAQVHQETSTEDPTWAYLVVNNPSGAASVTWNPTDCVAGDQWELRDAQDWDAAALQTLPCSAGQSVTMTNSVTPNAPIGSVPNSPVNTGNLYRVFILTKVAGSTVTVSPATLPNAVQGVSYDEHMAASGGTGPYTWDISAGSLPMGLTLDADTGVISGMPSGGTGTSNFTVRATDSAMATGTQPLSITVEAADPLSVTTTTLQSCLQNSAYSQPINATGGVPPYTYSVFSGTLPAGLSLGASTGVISGTCSGPVEVKTLVFRATDSDMATADSGSIALSVLPNATVPITCTIPGNGRSRKMKCSAPGLPITQVVTARVFDGDGQEVEEVNSTGGPAQRQILLGASQALPVGDLTAIVTTGGSSTEVDFSTAATPGTGSLNFRLAAPQGRSITNALLSYGTSPGSLSTSVSFACTTTCGYSIGSLTRGTIYYFRIIWRDAMNATVLAGPIQSGVAQ